MTEAKCYFCGEGFEEGEDRHTPNENKLAECHAACCDEPDCKEEGRAEAAKLKAAVEKVFGASCGATAVFMCSIP
jgi:hypothetical protein